MMDYFYNESCVFGFNGLFMFLFWGLIIFGFIVIFRYLLTEKENQREEINKSLDILKTRYAKGKINKKEFEEKKQDLI